MSKTKYIRLGWFGTISYGSPVSPTTYSWSALIPFTKEKAVSLGLYWRKDFWCYFSFSTNWTRKMDHAGFNIEGSLLWFSFEWEIYDRRHWYHDAGRYYLPGEEQQVRDARKQKELEAVD